MPLYLFVMSSVSSFNLFLQITVAILLFPDVFFYNINNWLVHFLTVLFYFPSKNIVLAFKIKFHTILFKEEIILQKKKYIKCKNIFIKCCLCWKKELNIPKVIVYLSSIYYILKQLDHHYIIYHFCTDVYYVIVKITEINVMNLYLLKFQ